MTDAIETDLERPTDLSGQQPAGSPAPEQQAPAVKPFLESLPQEYASQEWAQNFSKTSDPWAELAKSYANQQALIGKKAEGLRVPGEGATPEDWNNFHKSIGVPESADGYEYKAPEVPEALKPYFATDENFLTAMKAAAIKAGVRPEGFKHLTEAFDQYYLSELQNSVQSAQQVMQKLETDFKSKFGEKSGQVLDSWKNSFSSMLGEKQATILDSLDPSIKVVLAEHYHNFASKYINEDSLNLGVPNVGNQTMTQNEYGERYAELFARVRQTKPGSAEHQQAQNALKNLREQGSKTFAK